MSHPKTVFFVGAGPAGADLITLRGARALAQAQVVLHDALTDPQLRDLAPQAQWIDVGKRGFCQAMGQTRINALLVQHARSGAVVVRLKGGDPSIFGRLEEELTSLHEAGFARDAIEVIPGVTAALAAAAAAQRPLTRRGRGRTVSLTTAMTESGTLQAARSSHTQVFYMAGRQLAALSRQLRAAGWPHDTPVHVVSRAGGPDQLCSEHCVGTLAEAAMLHSGRPSVVCVGVGASALGAHRRAATLQTDPEATSDSAMTPDITA
jgi:uroporphyrin-III C-methyltransferase